MKRYIRSGNSDTPSSGIKFYHYDRRKFNVGDTLVGKFHTCQYPQVLKIYSEKNPQISDFQDVLYLYDTRFDSMFETCKYCYEVKPDCIEKRYSDYSYMICLTHIPNLLSKLKNTNENSRNFIIDQYITLMSDAYLGDSNAITQLHDLYGLDISSEIEYICNSAEVLKVFEAPEL